jgi:hypothetical protein
MFGSECRRRTRRTSRLPAAQALRDGGIKRSQTRPNPTRYGPGHRDSPPCHPDAGERRAGGAQHQVCLRRARMTDPGHRPDGAEQTGRELPVRRGREHHPQRAVELRSRLGRASFAGAPCVGFQGHHLKHGVHGDAEFEDDDHAAPRHHGDRRDDRNESMKAPAAPRLATLASRSSPRRKLPASAASSPRSPTQAQL